MDLTRCLVFIVLVSSCCALSTATNKASTSSTEAPPTPSSTSPPATSTTPTTTATPTTPTTTTSATTTTPTTTTRPTTTTTTTTTTKTTTTSPTTTTSTSITTTPSPTTSKKSTTLTSFAVTAMSQDTDLKAENKTLKIVVGILAAVIGLAIIIAGIYCILRRRRRRPPFLPGGEEEPAIRHEKRPYFRPASNYDLGNSPARTVSTSSELDPMTPKSNKGNLQMFTFSNGSDDNPKEKPLKEINENEEL